MRDAELAQQLSELIGHIYDAALDQTLWSNFSDAMSRTFRGSTVLITQDNKNTGTNVLTSGFDPAFVRSYVEHYYKVNPWIPATKDLAAPTIVFGEALVPKDIFDRSEFYNDYCKPQDLYFCVGCIASNDDGVVSGPSVLRAYGEGEFRPAEVAALRAITEHFRRALQISRQLAITGLQLDAALQGLDRLATAALIVDASARVLFANPVAEAMLRANDGLCVRGGCLASAHTPTDTRLRELIRRASLTSAGMGPGGGNAISLPRGLKRPLAAFVSPAPALSGGFGLSPAIALVFVRDPNATGLEPTALRRLFGLTRAEAALAAAVADGASTEAFANERGISIHTANTHLKNLMRKTQTSRQAELVALLLKAGFGRTR